MIYILFSDSGKVTWEEFRRGIVKHEKWITALEAPFSGKVAAISKLPSDVLCKKQIDQLNQSSSNQRAIKSGPVKKKR